MISNLSKPLKTSPAARILAKEQGCTLTRLATTVTTWKDTIGRMNKRRLRTVRLVAMKYKLRTTTWSAVEINSARTPTSVNAVLGAQRATWSACSGSWSHSILSLASGVIGLSVLRKSSYAYAWTVGCPFASIGAQKIEERGNSYKLILKWLN